MKAIRLTITENPYGDRIPRRTVFVIRVATSHLDMYETTEGIAQADTEKTFSAGRDRSIDLRLSIESCDV